jgi:hypothetical protein
MRQRRAALPRLPRLHVQERIVTRTTGRERNGLALIIAPVQGDDLFRTELITVLVA